MSPMAPISRRSMMRRCTTMVAELPRLRRMPNLVRHKTPKPIDAPQSFLWGTDGFVRSAAVTAGVAAAAGLMLTPLAAGIALPTAYSLASVAYIGTSLVLVGTAVGLWSATDLGNDSLLQRQDLALAPKVTLGLCLAPLVAAGSMMTAALAASASLTLVGLSYLTALRQGRTHISLTAGVAVLAASAVLGPTGWLVLGGLSAHAALGAALVTASSSTLVCAAVYGAVQIIQRAPPTELVNEMQVPDEVIDQARLEGLARGELPPTIFNVPEEFSQLTKQLQELTHKDGPIFSGYNGLCVATLYGPPGSGKTFSAAGLAQALGALFISCDNASLKLNNVDALPETYMNLVTLLMEAQLKAERQNRPAVILVDEVDAFLPRADGKDDQKAFNDVVGFLLLINTLSLLASGKTNIVLLMATNHPEQVAPLLGRMSHRPPIFMGPPDRQAMGKIFNTQLSQLHQELQLRHVPHGDLSIGPRVAEFVERLDRLGLTGRALGAVRESALRAAIRANKNSDGPDTQSASGQQEHVAAIDRAIDDAIDAALSKLESRGSQAQSNAAYARMEGLQSLEEVDRLMEKMGLKDLDPFEIIRRLSEQLLATYIDPSQSVPLSMLSSRFYMTLAQLAMVYTGHKFSRQASQDLTDVRPDAGATMFNQNDLQGQVTDILKSTWADFKRGNRASTPT